ncbi:MAG TPA: alpha/beta hydrolase [Patescibacteria group bacterium]|nr:alpha/beta hydrolase [Patescibacteria group bacterium]
MKKAIIFHGTDETPDTYWYKWLAGKLEERGYTTEIPAYPEINHEDISTFLPKVLKNHVFSEDTVLVGHSAGGPLLLSILEHIDAVIPQAILVAGYAREKPGRGKGPIIQESYDWKRIKNHVKDIYFVNSINDPWGCDDKQGRIMFEHLGGTQIIRDEGHFGSGTFGQPYPTFELLNKLID